jgi:hypothetical protein
MISEHPPPIHFFYSRKITNKGTKPMLIELKNQENARRVHAFAKRFGNDLDATVDYLLASYFKRNPLPIEDENPAQAVGEQILADKMAQSREERILGQNPRFEKGRWLK